MMLKFRVLSKVGIIAAQSDEFIHLADVNAHMLETGFFVADSFDGENGWTETVFYQSFVDGLMAGHMKPSAEQERKKHSLVMPSTKASFNQ